MNLNIKPNDKNVGYPIPNQKEDLTFSLYAADTNVLVITDESIVEILNFLKQYEIANGTTINISRAVITPLANPKLYNLEKKIKNVQNNNPENFVKILGIYLMNDLQKTSTYRKDNTFKHTHSL